MLECVTQINIMQNQILQRKLDCKMSKQYVVSESICLYINKNWTFYDPIRSYSHIKGCTFNDQNIPESKFFRISNQFSFPLT